MNLVPYVSNQRKTTTTESIIKSTTQQTSTPISVNQTPQNMGKKRLQHDMTGYADEKADQVYPKVFK
jgi:hypothetical protein